MFPTLSITLTFIHIMCLKVLAERSYEAQSRLQEVLLTNYSKEIRPVADHRDNVTISVGVSLSRIQEMNDKSQILTLSVWIRQVWYDPRLVWNVSKYAMTEQIHIDPKKIWVPDLKVYNEVDSHLEDGLDQLHTKAIVYSSGKIKWMSPSVKHLSCHVDMRYFPHDIQTCKMKIGSWTYDGFAVDVQPDDYTMDISKSSSNPEWELVTTSVRRNVQKYKCCPEPYPDVTYIMKLKRRERSYWMNFIFPGMFLTVLTMMTFVTPAPDIGERLSLVLTSLVSMFFFLKLVSERTPASDTIPLLSVYFVTLSFEIGLILYSVALSLNAYHKHPALGDMPNYVRTIVLQKLGNAWKMHEDRQRIKRRLEALQDLSKIKNEIKHELETIKNGSLSKSRIMHGKEISRNGDYSRAKEYENTNNFWIQDSMRSEDLGGTEAVSVKGKVKPMPCTCAMLLKNMVKTNNRILFAIKDIAYVARERDKTSSEQESWLLAASISDRVFFVFFLFLFIAFSLVNFFW